MNIKMIMINIIHIISIDIIIAAGHAGGGGHGGESAGPGQVRYKDTIL